MKTIEEIFMEHIQQFKRNIIHAATERFKDEKGLEPVVFALVMHEGKPALAILEGLAAFFTSDENKELAAKVIKESTSKIKPLALCFVSEGWASTKSFDQYESVVDSEGNYREGVIRPKDDPDRKEILMLIFETHNKESFVNFEILREGEEVTLKELSNPNWQAKKGDFKGRFANLLEDNYSELAQTIKDNLSKSQN